MMKISKKKLVYPYIILLPFVSAFALTGVLPLPFIYSVILGVLLLLNGKLQLRTGLIDVAIVLFVTNLFVSILLNTDNISKEMLMHLFAWISVIIFMIYVPRLFLRKIDLLKVLKLLKWSYVFVCVFCIVELLLSYVYSIDINSYIPRPVRAEYDALYNGMFVRARATFFESGHCGMFLGAVLPFVFLYNRSTNQSVLQQFFIIVLTILAALACISSAFFIFLPIAFILSVSIFNLKLKYLFWGGVMSIIGGMFFSDYLFDFWEAIYVSKFQSSSMTTRYYDNLSSINIFLKSDVLGVLFGHGPGSYSYLNINPATSGYVTMLLDLGVVGVVGFLLIFTSVFIWLIKNASKPEVVYYAISLFVLVFYLISINTYYFSFMWFLLAIMINKESLRIKFVQYTSSMVVD